MSAGTPQSVEIEDLLERAIRTLLPGLRVANYVERWASGSPAAQALSILSEHVGEGPVDAGETVDPDVLSAHTCRPAGLVYRPGQPTPEATP